MLRVQFDALVVQIGDDVADGGLTELDFGEDNLVEFLQHFGAGLCTSEFFRAGNRFGLFHFGRRLFGFERAFQVFICQGEEN